MRHLPIALVCLVIGSTAVAAPEPACKPVIDADKARASAPQWHMRKSFAGSGMEVIRIGEDVYANMGGTGWTKMPPAMAKTMTQGGSQAEQFDVRDCKKLGEEKIAGVDTNLYSFTTVLKGQPPFKGKVWVGKQDGLPYREQGDQHEGTTVYEGVSAPPLN